MNDGVDWRCDACNVEYKNCGGGDVLQCKRGYPRRPSICQLRIVRHVGEPMVLGAILLQRGTTHGDFGDNAKYALQARDLMRSMVPGWSNCTAEQRLALDEMQLKIARILSGGQKVKEHWDDLGGYSMLGGKACDN